jgi:hypothetical protein
MPVSTMTPLCRYSLLTASSFTKTPKRTNKNPSTIARCEKKPINAAPIDANKILRTFGSSLRYEIPFLDELMVATKPKIVGGTKMIKALDSGKSLSKTMSNTETVITMTFIFKRACPPQTCMHRGYWHVALRKNGPYYLLT